MAGRGGIRFKRARRGLLATALAAFVFALTAPAAGAAVGDLGFAACIQDPAAAMAPDSQCASETAMPGGWGLAAGADGRQVYTTHGDGGAGTILDVFSRDPATGALDRVACFEDPAGGGGTACTDVAGLGTGAIAISPDGASLYVAGTVLATFSRNPSTGELAFAGCLDDEDQNPRAACGNVPGLLGLRTAAMSPDGAHLYTGSTTDAAVVTFARDPAGGGLTFSQCLQDKNSAPTAETQCGDVDGLDDVTDVAVSADGRSVLASGRDSDAVVNLSRDPATGALAPAGCFVDDEATVIPGCAASSALEAAWTVAISPDGTSAYVGANNDDAVTAFDRDPATGALTASSCFQDNDAAPAIPGCTPMDGLENPLSVLVSPDARSVYVTGNDDTVVALTRDPATRALTFAGCIDDDDLDREAACPGAPGLAEAWELDAPADGRGLVLQTRNATVVGFSREPDAAGPVVVVQAARKQKARATLTRAKGGKVDLTVTCVDEFCPAVAVSGKLTARVEGKKKKKKANFEPAIASSLQPGQALALTLNPKRKAKKLLKKAGKGKVALTVSAVDLLGNATEQGTKVKLKRKR